MVSLFRLQAPALKQSSGENRVAILSQGIALKDILSAHFRANPGYELILFDRLPEEYRKQLAALQMDAGFYGVLWPHIDGLALKAVDRETALLFLTMQQSSTIPGYIRSRFGERCNQAIAELVLDGVLQMAVEPEGVFISGAAAYSLIYETKITASAQGRIARLSMEAIDYGQAIHTESSSELSARLYAYNTVPASPYWHKLIPTADAVPDFLGINGGGQNRAAFEHFYHQQSPGQKGAGWRVWHLRREWARNKTDWRPTHKLYISPQPEALPNIIGTIVEVLGAARVSNFKIGQDIYGLLRPDKIVAYFDDFQELADLAARMQTALAGCPAQGVPFTAGIDPDGLLSWGMDPPLNTKEFKGLEQESWRFWVTNRLAIALTAGKAKNSDIQPALFALERLRLDGVDTDTWTPQQSIWQAERRL